jgi:glycosyltransferase involved in cell wall biosynthesis
VTNTLCIMGTRGVPAAHGGFETFAEYLSLHLVSRGWQVVVYCQEDGRGPVREDHWRGVRRVIIPVAVTGAKGTILFDWLATWHVLRAGHRNLLTLGYNTAVFCLLLRLFSRHNVINMDGIEWKRAKWSALARTWLWLNERIGCWSGNALVADHPEILRHLATRVSERKITMIPYGAPELRTADAALLSAYGVAPGRYAVVIARPEPENSLLEIVAAFSQKARGITLLVLGQYQPAENPYHAAVMAAAGPEVRFAGAIYEPAVVQALRFHARFYVHGHQVGGTNPSLVEALGAGNAVLAHDNPFNRWVAGDGAVYFSGEAGCAAQMDALVRDAAQVSALAAASRRRHAERFTWAQVLAEYEQLLRP